MTFSMSRRLPLKAPSAVLAGLVTIVPHLAFPWGDEGPRIVATLAEHRLEKEALEGMHTLLGQEGLASISAWADTIRSERPETRPWHFVDIPLSKSDYSPERDCATPHHGDCIIGAIERAPGQDS